MTQTQHEWYELSHFVNIYVGLLLSLLLLVIQWQHCMTFKMLGFIIIIISHTMVTLYDF